LTPEVARLDQLSSLIGKIYDAALEPDDWPAVLDSICKLLNAQTAALWSYDVFDRTPPWQLDIGYDPYWKQQYTDKYLALNPYMDDIPRMSPGDVRTSSSRAEYPELFKTEFYQGWLKPQRFIDASTLMIEKSMNTITTLTNVRNEDQGPFDSATIDVVSMLYPHLRRAVLIGRAFAEQQERSAEYAAVLDALSAGMFLLTESGEIAHANAAGEAMLAAGSPLEKTKGRLELADGSARRVLREALAAARGGDVALGGKGTSIPLRGNDGAEFIVHMLPLNAARQKSIDADRGAAFVVFVRRNDPGDASAIAAFAARFELTAQETRVLQTVVEVGGVPMAADVLGIAPATARTHVTSIFDKTGVRRQADLLRLLMETKSPFVR
jgi:DNA-binding CsgD family transcriptional regulator/PAS domain-containing protein